MLVVSARWCFQKIEGSEDALEKNRLRLLVHSRSPNVLQISVRVLFPHLLELVDLVEADLPRPKLLLLRRHLDEPREEGPVVDDGRPLRGVPDDVLGRSHGGAGLSGGNGSTVFVSPRARGDRRLASTYRQRRTTTVSLLAGMKPSMKTFLLPQL